VRSSTDEAIDAHQPIDTDQSADAAAPRGRPRDSRADAAILAATFRQLVDVGYAGLSIESVAAEAGVAKTTLYRRHPTKKELVVAALVAATPFVPPPVDLPTRQALEQFVRAAIHMLIDSGAFRVLGSLLLEESREPGLLATFRARLLAPRRALVEAMLQRGIERGEIRPDIDSLVVTEMIAGAIIGHHVILGLHGDEAWINQLIDHVWRAIAVDR
jgi:AcrR family transcriptional regulator